MRATSERGTGAALALARSRCCACCCSRPARCMCAGGCRRQAPRAECHAAHVSATELRLTLLRDVVGAAQVLDRAATCRPTSSTGASAGAAGAGGGAARHRPTRWPRSCAPARRPARRIVPQGGNTGLVGGGVPDDSGTQVLLSLTRLNRVREIDRRQPDADGRGRLRAAGGAAGRRRRRPAVPAEPGRRRQLHDRRQPGHQCRRHAGAALRQRARAVPRARGRDGRRARSGTAWRACARTTPATTCATSSSAAKARWAIITAATLAAAPAAGGDDDRAGRRARRSTHCVALLGLAQQRLGAGPDRLRGDEPASRWRWWRATSRSCAQPLPTRAAGRCCSSCRTAKARPMPATSFEGLLGDALEAGTIDRRGGRREPGAVARAVAPARVDPAGAEPRKA